MRNDISSWLILRAIPGIGDVRFRYLVDHFGSPEEALHASISQLSEVKGIDRKIANAVITQKSWIDPEKELILVQKHQVNLITYLDENYPVNLKTIYDFPSILYVQGNLKPEDNRAIAIVGSRRATTYGRLTAHKLAQDLVLAGLTVVSGFAHGIDTEAHLGAIECNGRTIAVIGNGIDVNYPRENQAIRNKIIQNQMGCVISEFPMGTTPEPANFPKRNRIISGLSLGVVVVEATDTSGALLTAEHALDQNRFVFAIPGNVTAATSRGTNKLIQQGAKLITTAEDILVELGFVVESNSTHQAQAIPALAGLLGKQKIILEALTTDPIHIDQIAITTNLTPADLAKYLLELELKGYIKEVAGKRFIRIV
jgi:DNA processing protein